jgi:hypothetical protein
MKKQRPAGARRRCSPGTRPCRPVGTRTLSAKGSCKPLSPSTACRGYADPASPAGIGRARSPNGRRIRQQAANRTVIRPSAAEITHMETAFEWLGELRVEDSGMALVTTLWALRAARGRSIKKFCAEKQWAPHTFFRKRAKALASLAEALNACGVPVF